ncbi:major facilitator superfamily domain-containing protein [Ephemerocybe angulata]|uniref:Major facilitator superfamily domain-containing protein n=1 Tax=Ephemerocybe angulata TaxID=980116 RepID=A0A8H6M008_9AGAR|nr:major facilitator superfamily domain-containing protein [Tulosesus angulatus]
MSVLARAWASYTPIERRNIGIYIAGIMFYKLGLEFFNGSITTLATDRFNAANTFTKLGAAQGINQAAQCIGAILIAPLVKKFPTRSVLSTAIILFALMTALLLIVDAATGGHFKDLETNKPRYGSWHPNLIFLVWTISGVCYGMVELLRRVIPADIVGGDVSKLRRMDAVVHVFYEVAGTAGAVASSSAISRWGNNYSFFLTPAFFAIAGGIWICISILNFTSSAGVKDELDAQGLTAVVKSKKPTRNWFIGVMRGLVSFGESVWVGARLIFTNRAFVWLLPSYAIALYLHRFLENSLAPAFAKRTLTVSAWSQIIVGGSNFGELLGALSVFLLSDSVPTPLPWIRFDAVALNIVWILPAFAKIVTNDVRWAWKVAVCFVPISMGWAAGDVSLTAYIQSALTDSHFKHPTVSALGAVMAFLYATYIAVNAVLSTVLGKVIDKDFEAHNNIINSLQMVGGVHFTVACTVILASTFIPKGAFSFNPKSLGSIKGSRPTRDLQLHVVHGEEDDDVSQYEKETIVSSLRGDSSSKSAAMV